MLPSLNAELFCWYFPYITLHLRSLSQFWFPFADDTELSDVPAVSNVRQDLTEWQEKHANLVLSTVKVTSFFFF